MDSRQVFGYSVTSADLSLTSSHPTVSSIPNCLLGYLKFDPGNSPDSPFSTQFDCNTLTTFSDSQEQHSSTENHSGFGASCSSVETNIYFNHLSPSEGCRRDSLEGYSSGTSLLQNASASRNVKNFLLELETVLMAPDAEEVTVPSPSLGDDRRPQIQSVEEAECRRAYDSATEFYMSAFDRTKPPEEAALIEAHDEAKQKSLAAFNANAVGAAPTRQKYEKLLQNFFRKAFEVGTP